MPADLYIFFMCITQYSRLKQSCTLDNLMALTIKEFRTHIPISWFSCGKVCPANTSEIKFSWHVRGKKKQQLWQRKYIDDRLFFDVFKMEVNLIFVSFGIRGCFCSPKWFLHILNHLAENQFPTPYHTFRLVPKH